MFDAEELRERQEVLEEALQRAVHARLEFAWQVDDGGRLYGAARFPGNQNVSFRILPNGEAVVIH